MNDCENSITTSEWNLMESLWDSAPKIGSEVVKDLAHRVGWSRSTTLTMLRRMTEKGLISCQNIDGIRSYSPLVKREDAVLQETDHFLNRVYKGSISLMMSAITKKQELTADEIDELYAILQEAKGARND